MARTGIAPEKLILGLPYYGRDFRPDSPGYWSEAKNYAEIVAEYDPPPSADEAGGYAYNGPETIARKTEWAAQRGQLPVDSPLPG